MFWRLLRWPAILLAQAVWLAALFLGIAQAEDRLWLKAEINGKPVRLAFDTGASDSLLFPKTAEKLGLSFTSPPKNVQLDVGESPMGKTEECELSLSGMKNKIAFGVIEVPMMLAWDVEGVLGWKPLSKNLFRIDARVGTVESLDEVPSQVRGWVQLKILTESSVLQLEIPGPNGKSSIIFVDTGSSNGVKLHPDKWKAWKAAHKSSPRTLDAYYAPATGLVVAEEAWAKELSFGPLTITEVPVTEASKIEAEFGARAPERDKSSRKELPATYEATFGLAALKRLDVILDGQVGVAHLHPRETPPPAYEHNRLGAVFTPVNLQAEDLIAHVADGSPAQQAGIRDGDILVKIGKLDVTKWRTDPAVMPLTQFWTRPPGTKLDLTLKRGDATYETNVVLRTILFPPNDSAAK